MKNNIAIIGNGVIGRTIASLLKSENYNVTIADKEAGNGVILLDATYEKQIEHYLRGKDVVVSATPFFLNFPPICLFDFLLTILYYI